MNNSGGLDEDIRSLRREENFTMEVLEQLGVDPRILATQIAGFLILFFLLWKFGWPRLIQVIQAREQEVRDTYEKVESARSDMEQMRDEYESRLQKVEEEIDQRLRDSVKEAERLRQEIVASARQEADKARQRALDEIDMERKKAVAELRAQAVDLSLLATRKLIQQSVDEGTARRLVDEFARDLEQME